MEGGGFSEGFIWELLVSTGEGAEEFPPIVLFIIEVGAHLLV